ncbi:MAG: hypothetical protein QOJ63_1793 [Solirubrobacteraceae bacterium]|jgi:hypothetical protein|nr:hypothetical protein [Solirubrobacteraceae bacterium]
MAAPPATPPATGIANGASDAREGRIARGFRLARVSCEVLTSDPRLLLLPLLSALCAVVALAATAALGRRIHGGPDAVQFVARVWVAAYAVSFVTIFFNVALVDVVARRWRGERAGLADGLATARGRPGAIAGWAVLTTTVGLVLRLVERLTFGISQIVLRVVVDVVWSVASFLIVPVLAIERRGPVRALRRSAGIGGMRWAEGLGGATSIALATLVVMAPVVGLMLIGVVLYAPGSQLPACWRWRAPAPARSSSGSSASRSPRSSRSRSSSTPRAGAATTAFPCSTSSARATPG